MRRLFLVLLGSAILVSACGSSKATAPASSAAANPTNAPTVVVSAPVESSSPVAAASLAASNAGLDGDWITVAPDAAGFTAKFPTAPTVATKTSSTAVGDATTTTWTDEEGGNLVYYVNVAHYPAGSLPADKMSAMYDGGINGMLTVDSEMKLAGQADMTLGGHLGRTFLLSGPLGSLKGGAWIVGDDMYMVYVAYTSSVDPGLIDTFLSDFVLTV